MAITKLSAAIAKFQHKISMAGHMAASKSGMKIQFAQYPISVGEIALQNYQERLAFDDECRGDPRYSTVGIDDLQVKHLRDGIAGSLTDAQLAVLVGSRIDRFKQRGNTTAALGTAGWRVLARALCASELEAFARAAERDEGDYTGKPEHPMLAPMTEPNEELAPVSIRRMFAEYIQELSRSGAGKAAARRWSPVIESLVDFAGSDDANKITRKIMVGWKIKILENFAPRTVRDVYLAAIKAIFGWATSNEFITENPAKDITVKVTVKSRGRPKGFTRIEAEILLNASINYRSGNYHGAQRESEKTAAVKRWAPIICALTGCRISEVTQLRKEDIRIESGIAVMRISPDAGSVKSGKFRDVPLHSQLVELGFLEFVNSSTDGPLFHAALEGVPSKAAVEMTSGRISEWLNRIGVVPKGVQPSHGWRHAI